MAEQINITDTVFLDPTEIEVSYIRSSGPGGQNVNKVSTAAQLRFNLAKSASIPAAMKARALVLAGSRATNDGVIVITASSFRTQPQNRQDAIARLVALLQEAAIVPKRRKKTRPTLGSKKRRLEAKSQRSAIKSLRKTKPTVD